MVKDKSKEKDKEKAKTTIRLVFNWVKATPDPRQYNQQRQELLPTEMYIAVEMPIIREYFWNVEDILLYQLGTSNMGEKVYPLLTPYGMKRALDLLEHPFESHKNADIVDEGEEEWEDW